MSEKGKYLCVLISYRYIYISSLYCIIRSIVFMQSSCRVTGIHPAWYLLRRTQIRMTASRSTTGTFPSKCILDEHIASPPTLDVLGNPIMSFNLGGHFEKNICVFYVQLPVRHRSTARNIRDVIDVLPDALHNWYTTLFYEGYHWIVLPIFKQSQVSVEYSSGLKFRYSSFNATAVLAARI